VARMAFCAALMISPSELCHSFSSKLVGWFSGFHNTDADASYPSYLSSCNMIAPRLGGVYDCIHYFSYSLTQVFEEISKL